MTMGRRKAAIGLLLVVMTGAILWPGQARAQLQGGSYIIHRVVDEPSVSTAITNYNYGQVVKGRTAVANLALSLIDYFDGTPDTAFMKFVFTDAKNRLVFNSQINVEYSGDTVIVPVYPDSVSCGVGFCVYQPATAPFTVSFRPNERGLFDDTLQFILTSPLPDTIRFPVRGEGIGFLKLLSDGGQLRDTLNVTLANTRVGDSLPGAGRSIRVINTSDNQLGKISGVVMSNSSVFHVINPQLEIQPGEIQVLSVQFTPRVLGQAIGWSKIISDDFAVDTARVNLTGTGTQSLDYFTNDDTVLVEGQDPVHKRIDSLVVDTLLAGQSNDSLIWIQNRLNQNVELELVMNCGTGAFKLLSQFGADLNETDTLFAVNDTVAYRGTRYAVGDTIYVGCSVIEVTSATIVPATLTRTLPLNDSMRVWVRFEPELRQLYRDSIQTNYRPFIGEETVVTGYLPLRGRSIAPSFQADRDSIDFGPLTPGFTKRDSLRCTNTAGQLAVVVTVDTTGLDPVFTLLSERVFSYLPQQTFYVRFEYAAVDVAFHQDTVYLHTTDPNRPLWPVILTGGTQAPVIVPTPGAVVFGDVVVSDSLIRTVSIANIGLVDLTVTGMTVANPAVYTATPTAFTVAPGGSQAVSVQLKPAAAVAYPDTLRISSNDPKRPVLKVSLSGGGSDPQYTGDTLLTFGATTLNAGVLIDSVQICNTGSRGNMICTVYVENGTYFSLARKSDSLVFVGAGQCRWIPVRFSQSVPDIVWDSLAIVTNDPATGTAYIALSGGGFFKELDWLSGPLAGTTAYQFDKVSVYVADTLVSVMTNLGNDTLDIISVQLYSGAQGFKRTTPTSGRILQDEKFDVGIRFMPPAAGVFSDTMLIVTDDTTSGNDSIVVPLEGTGFVPGLHTDVSSFAFDTTEIGFTALDSIAFYNTGQNPVSISGVTLANGTRFAVASYPPSIAGDDTSFVKITFSPLDTISYVDTLRLTTTDPPGTITLPLAGSGAGGRYVDNTDSLHFNPTPVFGTSQLSFIVTNAGNRPLEVLSIKAMGTTGVFKRLSPASLILGAGEAATVNIGFTPLASAAYADTLVVTTSDQSNDSVFIPMYGETPDQDLNFIPSRLVRVTDPHLDVGDVPVGSRGSKRIAIYNVGLDTLHIVKGFLQTLGSPWSFAGGQLNNKRLLPGDSIKPEVGYEPAEKRSDTNWLIVVSNDPDLDTVAILLTAAGVSGQLTRVSPGSVFELGTIKVGTVDTSAWVSIQNTYSSRVRLSYTNFLFGAEPDVDIQAGIHRVNTRPVFQPYDPNSPPTLGQDSIITYRMTYHPADTGSDINVFRIIGTPDNSGDTIDVPLSGRGAAPEMAVTPSFLDYGTLAIPTRPSDTSIRRLDITITNSGPDTLYVDTLIPLNAGAANYNDAVVGTGKYTPYGAWVIGPGEVRTFGVVAKVLQRKVYYDTLAMINNDSYNDPTYIYTRIVGTAPGDSGFVDTVRISDYDQRGSTIIVPVHLVFDEVIKRFSIPLRYTSSVYECTGIDISNTLLESVDGFVPVIDTVNNTVAIKGNVIFGPFIEPDDFVGTVFANLEFEPRALTPVSDSSITFDTAFIPPDVGYGLQDTALLVILPEFVAGRLDIVTSVDDGTLPYAFKLEQNFPNPFNPRTTIGFSVSQTERVSLLVYNLLGQKIALLVEDVLTPGRYEYEWLGLDQDGREVSSGIYFYHLSAGEFSETRKMVYMK